MSLLKSIAKIGKKVLKSVVPTVIGKVNPVLGAIAAAGTSIGRATVRAGVPATVVRNLPSVIGGSMLGQLSMPAARPGVGHTDMEMVRMYGGDGGIGRPRRRRRKGLSAKDLSSFKRVARLVDKYSKPVHKMRNFKAKREIV